MVYPCPSAIAILHKQFQLLHDGIPPLFPGDRSHVIEKRHNLRTQEREEHHEFVNIDEGMLLNLGVDFEGYVQD